jgi:NTE family protein
MTTELKLSELLKSVKAPLDRLKQLPEDLAGLNWWNVYPTLGKYRATGKALQKDLGLTGGDDFEEALLKLMQAKLGNDIPKGFTFSDLRARGLRPLKVVASDLSSRRPVVFSAVDEDAPVLSAVRGSMSYPFIFKPLIHHERRFVDGGLCSNLPAFVFDTERAQDRRPLIAFDLVSPTKEPPNPYGMGEFVAELYLAQVADLREFAQATEAVEGTMHLEDALRHRETRRADLYREIELAAFSPAPIPVVAPNEFDLPEDN